PFAKAEDGRRDRSVTGVQTCALPIFALANSSAYGLGGSAFSTDEQRAQQVADRLDVGMVHINAFNVGGEDLPFGGVKRSGFGRELGPLGMDEFVNKQLLTVSEPR